MRKRLFTVLAISLLGITTLLAKDFRVVTFKVSQMACENCEKKVKDNIKFEKGLKSLDTDLDDKTVTIKYDPSKTDVEKLKESFKKFKYEAVVVEDKVAEDPKKK